jgi:hypothetical protein
MTVTDWLTTAGIFLGPIVTVRVTRYLDDDQTVIRRGLRELFEMKRVIPMGVTNWPA